jgi:hypothetical protein
VSPLELVDDRFDKLAEELRSARPVVPPALRERVRALDPPPRRRLQLDVPWRRVVPAVALAGVAAGLGVAGVLGIVHGSSAPTTVHAEKGTSRVAPLKRQLLPHPSVQVDKSASGQSFSATLSATPGRLQQYDAWLRVRVHNQEELSARTRDAMRLVRKLGGYVAWANFSTPKTAGDSELQLQIPIGKVQAAIAAFSGYGTLIGQRIRLKDLQQRADNLALRIRRLRARIARLNDPRDRARLAQLLRARTSTVKRAQMASVALTMVVRHKAKAAAAPPSRFHRTLDDAGSVLVRELEILLYAFVVAGPLLAIGGAGILASRTVRRRSDERLLERS